MNDDDHNDEDLTAEVHDHRPFSLAEAIGRAGSGNLKGASPVAGTEQVLAGVEELLDRHLRDPEGSLARTLLSRLRDDTPLLARHFGDPRGALVACVRRQLPDLADLVRDTDARWGRDYDERPRFETGDAPPRPDDPYTLDGVRATLGDLLTDLLR